MTAKVWIRLWVALTLCVTGLHVAASPWPPTGAESFLEVSRALPFRYEWQGGGVLITWNTAPGYALYKKQLKLGMSPEQWRTGPWKVAGTLEVDQDAEPDFRERYVGPLEVFIPLTRLQADAQYPIIQYQGCSLHGLCYPPQRAVLQRN